MPVYDQSTVGRHFVLANARLNKRRVFEQRKAIRKIFANRGQAFGGRHAFSVRWVERFAWRVFSHFESAPLISRDAIEAHGIVVNPSWEAVLVEPCVADRRTEVERLLARRRDRPAEHIGEQLPSQGPHAKT